MPEYALLGIMVILVGVVIIFMAAFSTKGESSHGETKAAVVLMLGPIPIVFGNDSRLIIVAMVLAIVLIVLALFAGLR